MKQLTGKPLRQFMARTARPQVDLVFLLQDVEDAANVGAAFRIADACRVSRLILAGTTPCPPHHAIAGVGRGTHRRVDWRYAPRVEDAIRALRQQGYVTCALEITRDSAPYWEIRYPDRLCLVVGNEYHGVTKQTLALCDMAIYLPMYGKILSLNVHVALGIVAYHVLHERRNRQA